MEMEAFDDGILTEIYVKDGEKVLIGQKLALLSEQDEKADSTATRPSQAEETTREQAGKPKVAPAEEPAAKSSQAKETTHEQAPKPKGTPAEELAATTQTPTTDAGTEPSKDQAADDSRRDAFEPTAGSRIKASPLAKKIAAEMGVDLARLQGSGPGGVSFGMTSWLLLKHHHQRSRPPRNRHQPSRNRLLQQPRTKRYLCPVCEQPSPHACWRARQRSHTFISRLKSTPSL